MCAETVRKLDMTVRIIPHPGGRSKNWYVCIQVPRALQPLVGQKEVNRSTFTADRTRAKTVAASIEAELRAKWLPLLERTDRAANAAKPTILSESLITQICGVRLGSWHLSDEGERFGTKPPGADDFVESGLAHGFTLKEIEEIQKLSHDSEELAESGVTLEEIEAMDKHADDAIAAMNAIVRQGKGAASWAEVVRQAREFAADLGYEIGEQDPLLTSFIRRFATVERDAQQIIKRRNNGDDAPFPTPESGKDVLSSMLEKYAQHRHGVVAPKTISKNLSIWHRFIEFKGDVPIDSVTSGDLYNFLKARLNASTDAWSQGYVDGHGKRALKDMFALARALSLSTAPNPVEALEVTPKLPKEEQEARCQPRFPIKAPQLSALFESDWYDPDASHWTGKMRTDLAARYWGPLIAMCHGSRVREVVQLMSHDFAVVEGVLLMTIQTSINSSSGEEQSLPERSLKNKSTRRTVPVHPTLIDLGFGQFIRTFQATHPLSTPLFPSAVPQPGGKSPLWGRAYEQAFLRHVRDRLAFGKGFGNHSFRHQAEDRIRAAQVKNGVWPAGLAELFTGRKLPRKTDRDIFREQSSAIDYGDGFVAQHLLGYAGQVTFDDVKLPVPYEEWLSKAGSVRRR